MAKPRATSKDSSRKRQEAGTRHCSLPRIQQRILSHISDGRRLRLIRGLEKMWVNGTNLKYYFFREPAAWRGGGDQEQAARDAFSSWKTLGIGLTFQEVDS